MRREKTISGDLAELRARVMKWREDGGGRGSLIPEELWREAIRIARIEGVYWTARVLRFRDDRLKKRMDLAERAQRVEGSGGSEGGSTRKRDGEVGGGGIAARGAVAESDPQSRFIALGMAPRLGNTTTIELWGRQGDRMRIDLTAGDIDLAGVVQAFWSRPS